MCQKNDILSRFYSTNAMVSARNLSPLIEISRLTEEAMLLVKM